MTVTNTHSHGAYGWHDHPIFDSTADHIAQHDADELAKLQRFFAGATWHPVGGIQWPTTPESAWVDIASWQPEGRYESRRKA
jgi:hypothetical protein